MDINARINWQPGMQLTPSTFSNLDENLEIRQQAAVQAAKGTSFGRFPNAVFLADGIFVQGVFEIPQFKCLALLPDGNLINPDESVSLRFPRLSDGWAYLTVSLGMSIVEYEKEGVPYVRQSYDYMILSQAEMERLRDVLPIVRFHIQEGRCTLDKNFIPPCLMFSTDERLSGWRDTLVELLDKLVHHANMKEGDGHQTLLRYMFQLRSFNKRKTLEDFLMLVNEIVQAVNYYVVHPNEVDDLLFNEMGYYDVELWLSQIKTYLTDAAHILDGVVLKDESIDFEALKAQLKEEIYNMLRPELKSHIDESVQALSDSLNQRLSDALRDYIDGTFRKQLEEKLKVTVSEALRADLYDSLYKALYDALFVPQVQEEDNFMPLI